AEDAFQATWIVLVKKAESVAPRDLVGNWLYGVAHQTALQARRAAARRAAREVHGLPDAAEAARPDEGAAEVLALLDQELSRLPGDYRAVVVLCDLEGRTRKEVSRHLGVPEGTVAGRLARARAMLAKRLARRGVTLSDGALASMCVPEAVVASTLSTASQFASGQSATAGVVSTQVAALTEGVLRSMLPSKARFAAVAALALTGLLIAGVSAGIGSGRQQQQPPPSSDPALPPRP